MNPDGLWAAPTPIDLVAVAVYWAAWIVWQVIRRCTLNVAPLGPWWVATYWFSVLTFWSLGDVGVELIRQARRGNDFLEFANGRARWVGKVAVLFELQVRWDAFKAYAILGYPAAILLVVVGGLGLWTLVPVGVWAAVKAAEIRRGRTRRLRRR